MTTQLTWFKSSYSNTEGGECVEVALDWRTSSYSDTGGGNCVEVAECSATVHVRDSKDPSRAPLTFPAAAWTAFLTHPAR